MNKINQIYTTLYKTYGPQGWWPLSKGKLETKHHNGRPKNDKDRFEIIAGAILTQNTSWKNVEKAIYNLNKAKLLDSEKIRKFSIKKIANLIRPAGYFNQKAERLKIIADYIHKRPLKKLFAQDIEPLRKELLAIKGIGPETADSIILYSAEKPIFVVDAYTKRIFSRLGFFKENIKYDDAQKLFMDSFKNLRDEKKKTEIFKEYHALIVEHAKRSCRTKAECESCIFKICKMSRPA